MNSDQSSLDPLAHSPAVTPPPSGAGARVHVSVLPREIVEWLAPGEGKILVDGTLGAGGHTRLLAERLSGAGFVLAVDRDPAALAAAEINLKGLPVKIASANFSEIPQILDELEIPFVDGIVLDLGLSSDQLADRDRGFSFESTGSLDLRFNPDEGEPAWRMLERLREEEIANLIFEFGEERFSRRIAKKIVEQRTTKPIRTADELARLVRSCIPFNPKDRIDPATRTFQGLRIAVNQELHSLDLALQRLPSRLKPGGRLAIISFHSTEDRLVKQTFRSICVPMGMEILTNRPITPSDDECRANPRSRSAKLRAVCKPK